MPFESQGLTPLLASGSFVLWRYATSDPRAAVLASGYFAPVAARLGAGHLVVLQAADASALLPIRDGGVPGPGLLLDTNTVPLRLAGSSQVTFGLLARRQAVQAAALLTEAGDALLTEARARLLA
ncbi:hypothetical protein LPC08_02395 [Roseomonas sp. OT10]|uniref:hypothetical protein n=1 Tax=Roseomonas cutis TaxID=2897332 RepID=UPI001E3AA135|nr:hypothetical protein [Roseomonas sp. OT10]UFN49517.1 hypothetical protein LPC08_02395 [Roseomonas sp. OT10]